MKKIWIGLLCIGFIIMGTSPLVSQEEQKEADKKITADQTQKVYPPYSPRGRRDPFRNLIAGRDVGEKPVVRGITQMYINDVSLIGIVKARGKYTAIINGPQGFPYKMQVGQKLADGFVLSIEEFKITFRKTRERGIPLRKPRDIVKEIKAEEQ